LARKEPLEASGIFRREAFNLESVSGANFFRANIVKDKVARQ